MTRPEIEAVYLTGAQMRAIGEMATDQQLVVLRQENLLTGRPGVHGWVMVETITGNERELTRLDNEGNERTVEEAQAAIEAG